MRRLLLIVIALVILGGIGYGGFTLGNQRGLAAGKATAASDRSAFQASRGSAAAGGGQGAGAGGFGGAAGGGQGGNGGGAAGGQGGAGRGAQGGTPGAVGSAGAGTRMPATSGSPGAANRPGGPNGVTGRVTMVSGQTFAVQSSMDNTSVNVTAGGDTIFTKLVTGTTSDLKLNDFVIVQGMMSGDNAYTATTIRGTSAQQVAAVANAGITGMGTGMGNGGMGAGTGGGTPGGMAGRGGGMGAMGGRGAMGGAAVTGRITQLDVNTLTVATSDGTMVTVNTTPTTSIQTTKSASIGDIQAGDTVVVLGDRTGESVTARLVTDEGQG